MGLRTDDEIIDTIDAPQPSASGLDAVRNALSKPAPVAAIGNAPSPTFDLPQHSSASKTAPTWPCCKSSATKCRT